MDAIRRVGEALVARNDAIARGMVGRIVEEVPFYRRAPRGVIDDVLVLSTATAGILGQALAAGAPVRREDAPIVREHAALRLHQGVSLDAFLHAYRAALFGYWDECARAAAELGATRDESLALARFVLDAIDTITTHAAEAYLREETRVRMQSGREARDLVERLIRGQPVGDRRPPAAPGLDPTGRLVTIVGRVEQAEGAVGDALQATRDALEDSLALGTARPLVAIRHGEVILIAGGASAAHAAARLRMAHRRVLEEQAADVRFGVSVPTAGFAGVPRAYLEATLSLSYSTPARPIVSLADLSAFECALLGADASTRDVMASKGSALRALPDADRAAAIELVRAFSNADLNVSRAAHALGVHPNTVRYRLERVAATTGHDPRTFGGLVELLCVAEVVED
jgi:PucR-like helix-turn-helix protein/diguanylate cyclase with GGDEF domain